jgi:hypothetical protein
MKAVADVFGYHALQLGLPELDTLRANRMPHRWLALAGHRRAAAGDDPGRGLCHRLFRAAVCRNSLDLVTLPHTLEMHVDPHATLREVGACWCPRAGW